MLDKYVYANIISFLPETNEEIDKISTVILNKEEAFSFGIFVYGMANFHDLLDSIKSRKKGLAVKIALCIHRRVYVYDDSYHRHLIDTMLVFYPQAQIDYNAIREDASVPIDQIDRWMHFCPTYLHRMICRHQSIADIVSQNPRGMERYPHVLKIYDQRFVNDTFMEKGRDIILDHFQHPSRRRYMRHLSEFEKSEFREPQKMRKMREPMIISPMGYVVLDGYSRGGVAVRDLCLKDRQWLLVNIILHYATMMDIRYVVMDWAHELQYNHVWGSAEFGCISYVDRMRHNNSLAVILTNPNFMDMFTFDSEKQNQLTVTNMMIEVTRGYKDFVPDVYEKSVAYIMSKRIPPGMTDLHKTCVYLQSTILVEDDEDDEE